MSAETLALSRFSRRGTVPACENRSAAPAVPSLLRSQDALGAAAFVECKRMQRSRCAFLVELDSVEEFSDTPYRHAKSTPLSYRICIASAMVIIHQFYEPFLYKKTTFFVLYPILCFFLQKIIVSAWYITQKTVSRHFTRRRRKNRASPAKKGGPVFQYAENRRNSCKSYKPVAPGLFGHGHDARPAGGKRAGTKENPELFQMEKLRVSGGRGWIRTTEALSSRFTVCPHWPLGNTPLFCLAGLSCRTTCLFYHRLCGLSTAFLRFFRAARCGVLSSLAVFAPAVRPAAPDCLLILAPGARFVNSQFCFCCEIGIY